jgi:hypothetical protein
MRARGILIVAVIALSVSAEPAGAAKVRHATASAVAMGGTADGGPQVTAVARCPKGTKALSGGYTTSVPQVPNHWLAVNESAMTSKGDGWRVSGFEYYAAPASDTLVAHAYCEKRRTALSIASPVRTDFIPDAPDTSTSSGVECPRHTSTISGGFRTLARNAYFFESRPFGSRDWSVGVTNVGGAGGIPYIAEAYCAATRVLPRMAKRVFTGSASVATTPCPKRSRVGGGGFAVSLPIFTPLLHAALVYDTRLSGRAWSVTAAISGSGQSQVRSITVCRI